MAHGLRGNGITIHRRLSLPQSIPPEPVSGRAKPAPAPHVRWNLTGKPTPTPSGTANSLVTTPVGTDASRTSTSSLSRVLSGQGARRPAALSQSLSYEPPSFRAESSTGSLPGAGDPAAAQIPRFTSESSRFMVASCARPASCPPSSAPGSVLVVPLAVETAEAEDRHELPSKGSDAAMAPCAFQWKIEEHQRQQKALLAGMSAQWEERFSAMERGLRREIDDAAAGISHMKERSEKFVHLAEVLEDAVSKALRTCKDVTHLSREVQRIGDTVSRLAEEFSNDRASHCWTCSPRLSRCMLDSHNSARSLQEGLHSSNVETERIRELLDTTNEHLLRASRELTTTVKTSGIKHRGISADYAHRLESLSNELRGELACRVSQTVANGKPLQMSDWAPSASTTAPHTSFAEVELTDDEELHLHDYRLSVDVGAGSAAPPPQHGSTLQFVPESTEPRNVSACLAANNGTGDKASGPSRLGDSACKTAN